MIDYIIHSPAMAIISALGLFSVILGIIKSIVDILKGKRELIKPLILIIVGALVLAVILTAASHAEESKTENNSSVDDTRGNSEVDTSARDEYSDEIQSGSNLSTSADSHQSSDSNTTVENNGENNGIIAGGDVNVTVNGNSTTSPEPSTPQVSVFDVSINSGKLELFVGDSVSLLATVTYTDNTIDHSAIWFSSDPQIAEVDENGNVTALSPGSVTITAQASKNNIAQKAVCVVTVSEPPHVPSGYSIRLSTKQAIMWETFYVYVEPYEDDVTDIVIYAVSPSGDTTPFEYNPSKNDYVIYTEPGTWIIYASVTNSAGTYTAQEPEDFATIEVISVEDVFGDIVGS